MRFGSKQFSVGSFRFLASIFLSLGIWFLVGSLSWGFGESNLILDDLVKEAIENNPKIKALKKIWQAKRAKVLSEFTPPQPHASIVYFGESIQTKVGPQDKKFGIRQKIPFPTKLVTKGNIATKEAELAYTKYKLGIITLRRDVKSLFYDYYFVIKAIEILKEERAILASMRAVVKAKYEALISPQADLVKVDLAISRIDDEIFNLEKQKKNLVAHINKLLNRKQNISLGLPKDFAFTLREFKKPKEELLDVTLKKSPLILLDKLNIEKENLKFSLVKQEWLPDLGIMADYIKIGEGTTSLPNDGKDAWTVGLSFTFPLWFWKITSDIDSQKNKLISTQETYRDKENFLSFKIEDLYFKLNTNWRLVDLYKNVIVPQAKQNFFTSQKAYEGKKLIFLTGWMQKEI